MAKFCESGGSHFSAAVLFPADPLYRNEKRDVAGDPECRPSASADQKSRVCKRTDRSCRGGQTMPSAMPPLHQVRSTADFRGPDMQTTSDRSIWALAPMKSDRTPNDRQTWDGSICQVANHSVSCQPLMQHSITDVFPGSASQLLGCLWLPASRRCLLATNSPAATRHSIGQFDQRLAEMGMLTVEVVLQRDRWSPDPLVARLYRAA